jgi:5'-nucleotidase
MAVSLLTAVVGCSSATDATPVADVEPAETVEFVSADAGPLRILLTNDDGWDAPGITAVYGALTAAGHEVKLVGPATNNSGVSAAIRVNGDTEVLQPNDDPNIYSVATTPAGSVMFGMDEVFTDGKPDLVISGSNVGANTGFDTNFSGTVGAAVVGSGMFGVPSIAISNAVDHRNGDVGSFEEAADLLVAMIEQGLPELNQGTILNINYPLLADGETSPKGVRYAPVAAVSSANFGFERVGDTTTYVNDRSAAEKPAADTDKALLAEGFVTVTLLNTNRTVSEADVASASGLIDAMN